MEIIVTPISVGFLYYDDLYKWAKQNDDDPNDPDFDALSYMEGDPHKIKSGDDELYFITVELNGIKYILTHDEVNTKECVMLTRFFQDNFKDYFKPRPSSWEIFDKTPHVIAYRPEGQYSYAIWAYTARD